jgi:hypothetical protein
MDKELYWAYNLPLQYWPADADEEGRVSSGRIVNYMPRKESLCSLDYPACLGDQTHEEFFETAALYFENLAKLFRRAAADKTKGIYYHDVGMHEVEQEPPNE